MSVPVLTFFNNKGGVGKTSLVYHIASMLAEKDRRILVADLDPQANLTAAFVEENRLLDLWDRDETSEPDTIFRSIQPLTEVGDVLKPRLMQISGTLSLIPGDLALSGFEDHLSQEWPNSLGSGNLFGPFRVLTAFWQAIQIGAESCGAEIILFDVGPSLGAINRSALIASDFLVVPLAADLFSLQGLKNLGPTLRKWREEWRRRKMNWPESEFQLPAGTMEPIGYIVQQHSVRLNRPVAAYDRWAKRIPGEYASSVLGQKYGGVRTSPENDPNCIATVKHYRSLVPLAQDARKPIFALSSADGAIGAHSTAAKEAYRDFSRIATDILKRMNLDLV